MIKPFTTTATYSDSKDGHLENFGINQQSCLLYNKSHHEIVEVTLEPVTDKTSDRIYYGYKPLDKDTISLIYPTKIQLEVCFPDINYLELHGDIIPLRIKSIKSSKVVFKVHIYHKKLQVIGYLMQHHKILSRINLDDGCEGTYTRCKVLVEEDKIQDFLDTLNNEYNCYGIIPLTQIPKFKVKCKNCGELIDIPNDYLDDYCPDYQIGYLFECKSIEECGTQVETIIDYIK